MTMTAAEAKNASVLAHEIRNAPSATMSDDLRTALGDTAGFTSWPPSSGTELWEVRDLFNDMGYAMFEDLTITRDTATYPSDIGLNSAAVIPLILYLGTLDPGSVYSDDDTRAALWAYLPAGAQTFLSDRFNQWGYTVFEDLSVART